MAKELKYLADLGLFEMMIQPQGVNVLQSTWDFNINIFPDGTLKTYKSRFFVWVDQQIESLTVFDTYVPVVSWSTVRLMLVVSLAFRYTKQIDCMNFFCQAPLEQIVFVELPGEFKASNKVLLLK